MASEKKNYDKLWIWVLGALNVLASYIAYQQKDRIKSLEEIRQSDKIYYQKMIDQREQAIIAERKQKDSLQGLLLVRTDKSFEELKNIMNIKTKSSTITIKPKK